MTIFSNMANFCLGLLRTPRFFLLASSSLKKRKLDAANKVRFMRLVRISHSRDYPDAVGDFSATPRFVASSPQLAIYAFFEAICELSEYKKGFFFNFSDLERRVNERRRR